MEEITIIKPCCAPVKKKRVKEDKAFTRLETLQNICS